ncbi:MAG: 30S ribosomal protein S18 [FCB group bacterium]|nr:30S ribosomal protein S18 [FCB group bacterium]
MEEKIEKARVENTVAKPAEVKTENTKVEITTSKPAVARPERTYSRPSRPPQDRDNRKRTFKPRGKFLFKKKVCFFCKNKDTVIDYKDVGLLKRFISESGKITPKRFTGACTKHQRKIAVEIKKARQMALIQYTDKHKY